MKPRRSLTERFPGAQAHQPTGIPRPGWKQVARRVWEETQLDQVPLLAAGVAFWAFLSLFPAMIAAVAVYGLVADPATVTRQAEVVTDALPRDAASVIVNQMETISSQSEDSLNVSLLISVLLALWTSSAAVSNVMSAINTAYDEEETRTYVRRKGIALLLSLGAVAFVVTSVGLIAVAPLLLDKFGSEGATRVMLEIGRWVGLVLAVMAGTAVLYKVAPDRADRGCRGCPSAPSLRPRAGCSPHSGSRSTSTTSAATAARTARSRAWQSCRCGSGSPRSSSWSAPRSTRRRNSRRSGTQPSATPDPWESATRSRPTPGQTPNTANGSTASPPADRNSFRASSRNRVHHSTDFGRLTHRSGSNHSSAVA
jgi:uncharacterized BrkB/YihY/UPF0761 family membrane protein